MWDKIDPARAKLAVSFFCCVVMCFCRQDNRAISFDGMARACAEAMGKDPSGECKTMIITG